MLKQETILSPWLLPTLNLFMNKTSFILLSAALGIFSLASCKQAPESDEAIVGEAKETGVAEGRELAVNLQNSLVEWVGTKVTSYHNGTINLKSGELVVNNQELTGGQFVFDMSTIAVKDDDMDEGGKGKLTGHLLSDDFFAVETHPEASFVITSVEPFAGKNVDIDDNGKFKEISEYKIDNPTHTITGNLKIRGVEKSISFPAWVQIDEKGALAKAKFTFNRMDWGIKYPGMADDAISEKVFMGISLTTM